MVGKKYCVCMVGSRFVCVLGGGGGTRLCVCVCVWRGSKFVCVCVLQCLYVYMRDISVLSCLFPIPFFNCFIFRHSPFNSFNVCVVMNCPTLQFPTTNQKPIFKVPLYLPRQSIFGRKTFPFKNKYIPILLSL